MDLENTWFVFLEFHLTATFRTYLDDVDNYAKQKIGFDDHQFRVSPKQIFKLTLFCDTTFDQKIIS